MEPRGAVDLTGASDGVPERFVPEEMHGQLVEAEHVIRYAFATRFAAGRRVLDAGCGIGYGAAMLAEHADHVTAVDIADAVIEVARGRWRSSSSRSPTCTPAVRGPALSISWSASRRSNMSTTPERVLDELARVLAPTGLLLVSSPNRDRYVPGNPHHRHEYLPEELHAALRRRLPAVRLLQQHVMTASVLGPDEIMHRRCSRFVRARARRTKPTPSRWPARSCPRPVARSWADEFHRGSAVGGAHRGPAARARRAGAQFERLRRR